MSAKADRTRRGLSAALAVSLSLAASLAIGADRRAGMGLFEGEGVGQEDGEAEGEGQQRPLKEFKLSADNWSWTPDSISVEVGTLVRIAVRNEDATHRFDLKEYDLKVVLPQNQTTTFEFVADKVGEFRWKCGRPCGDGCPKMTGKLIVTAAGAAAGQG